IAAARAKAAAASGADRGSGGVPRPAEGAAARPSKEERAAAIAARRAELAAERAAARAEGEDAR
ncbi:hypothetical protein, partial [Propionibacterium acidifaciens]|uniref:hypothetical protein n=1 Tax=Propionibacterium acidifaciens TaxID=556499 RepID=UPI0028EAF3E4